jgi:hypothetical protein
MMKTSFSTGLKTRGYLFPRLSDVFSKGELNKEENSVVRKRRLKDAKPKVLEPADERSHIMNPSGRRVTATCL